MSLSSSINLVKGRKPDFLDQFISWALTVGKAVVILTETIALSAFLYRFDLDRKIVDLHDKIVQEQNIVRFLKKNEDIYRNLQNRLQLADAVIKTENQTIAFYKDLITLTPADVIIKSFTYSSDTLRIEANMQSISSLAQFMKKLQQNQHISRVSLDKIETKTETGIITVSITTSLKQIENKPL